MKYERLTKYGSNGKAFYADLKHDTIRVGAAIDRLAELEDKIERGEIDHVADSETEQRITDLITEFDEMGFAPTTLHPDPEQYAIDWRDQVRKEFARLTAERDDYKSRAEAAEQEVTSWKDCANKWQKYYKEEVVPLLEEMRNKQ